MTHFMHSLSTVTLFALLSLSLHAAATPPPSNLLFHETWATPAAVTPSTLTPTTPGATSGAIATSTQGLLPTIHGPYSRSIQSTPGKLVAAGPWAISLRRAGRSYNLSKATLQINHPSVTSPPLFALIKLPNDMWYVSNQSVIPNPQAETSTFDFSKLTWRRYNIISTTLLDDPTTPNAPTPNLNRVDEVGLTTLNQPGQTILHAIALNATYTDAPPKKTTPKKTTAPKAATSKTPGPIKGTRVPTKLPKNITAHRRITYAKYGDRELTLDLYRPAAQTQPLPAVVFIHGGGMYKGDPSSYTAMAIALAEHGYVTANIYYRLSGEALFPAALQDCKAAARFLRANAKNYGIDPRNIGSVGGSAGGWLSGLLATTGPVTRLEGASGRGYSNHPKHSSQLQAGCVMAGAMDWTTSKARQSAATDPRRRIQTFLGGPWQTAQENYIDSSAITHVDSHTPPMLFLDGEFDNPGTRYNDIRPLLKKYGIHSEEHTITGAPHPFWSSQPFFDEAMEHMVRFFNATLKK